VTFDEVQFVADRNVADAMDALYNVDALQAELNENTQSRVE